MLVIKINLLHDMLISSLFIYFGMSLKDSFWERSLRMAPLILMMKVNTLFADVQVIQIA